MAGMPLYGNNMPTVAMFEGIKIQFFNAEHPPPHFHAVCAEHRAQIDIDSLRVIKGRLPRAKLRVVISWARTRREALMQAWEAVGAKRRPEKIQRRPEKIQ
jgi:hypothetical protein